jgi:hypothetical protein
VSLDDLTRFVIHDLRAFSRLGGGANRPLSFAEVGRSHQPSAFYPNLKYDGRRWGRHCGQHFAGAAKPVKRRYAISVWRVSLAGFFSSISLAVGPIMSACCASFRGCRR